MRLHARCPFPLAPPVFAVSHFPSITFVHSFYFWRKKLTFLFNILKIIVPFNSPLTLNLKLLINLMYCLNILPFSKKGDLSPTDNYRGITLTCIGAKICNALLRKRIKLEIDNILRPNQNVFRRNKNATGKILTVRRIH